MIFDVPSDRKVRQFVLSPSFLAEFEGQQPQWGPVGYVTYKRTYALPVEGEGRTEEFWETCRRVVEGTYTIQKIHCRRLGLEWDNLKAQRSAQDMFRRMWEFKFTPPGRGLSKMGTDYVLDKGGAALNNCGFITSAHIADDFADPFVFLMDMSMLGVGVGADMAGRGKVKLQKPRVWAGTYEVDDSREGWCALARVVLNSFVGKGAFPELIDFRMVRPAGSPIRGFGGTASGPNALAKMIKNFVRTLMPASVAVNYHETFTDTGEIETLRVVFEGEGDPRPIGSNEICDIFNMVGACVVAGGARRTAEIMFGDADDDVFRNLKDDSDLRPLDAKLGELYGELHQSSDPETTIQIQSQIDALQQQIDAHPMRSHRWASNNSIFGVVGMRYEQIGEAIAKNGEPGIFWLKNAQDYGRMIDPPDFKDYRVMGCNPCFAGETLIATADGRGAVPIKQLVEEGKDVPVYSMNPKTGKVEIKMGRNPRMTRESSSLVEITLDDGSTLRVTPDHKMILLDGTRCEAKDLQPGDSLPRFQKRRERVKKGGNFYWQVETNTRDPLTRGSRVFEHRLIAKFHDPETWAQTYDSAKQSGWIKGGVVVHHRDYNPLNNDPANLEIMTFRDHAQLHGDVDNRGEKNPMWGRKHSADSKKKIGQKTRERCQDPVFLAKLAASHSYAERAEASERMSAQRREEMLAYYREQEKTTDLETVWMGDRLHAVRNCEVCQEEFVVSWGMRGQSYCSRSCMNKAESHIKARKAGQAVAFADKQRQTLHNQVMVFKDLLDELRRTPQRKEWEQECRTRKVPSRFRTAGTTANPYALTSYSHLQEVAQAYNHRVKAVRHLDVQEPVYNISIADHHVLSVVTRHDENSGYGGIFCSNCAEQSLESHELCTLVETYPAHHETYEDFERTLKVAYLYAKTVTLLPTHNPRTNAVMNRNRRIGCSMSGIRQAIEKFGRRGFLNWCDRGYKYITGLDRQYSEWLGVPRSIKMTSVKPSGTVSLLCNATPGIHPAHSPYYIRNIRMSSFSPLLGACRDAGYKVEKDAYADNTFVVSFPVRTENCREGKRDVSIWDQVALAADIQRYWADNQVSVTVTFTQEEAKQIPKVLEVFEDRLKSVSFLPLGDDHGYVQAPYIEITEDQYLEMSKDLRPIVMDAVKHEQDDLFCDGGVCMVNLESGG